MIKELLIFVFVVVVDLFWVIAISVLGLLAGVIAIACIPFASLILVIAAHGEAKKEMEREREMEARMQAQKQERALQGVRGASKTDWTA